MEHNKPKWDKLQAISVLTSDSPKLGPALKKNPYIYIYWKLIQGKIQGDGRKFLGQYFNAILGHRYHQRKVIEENETNICNPAKKLVLLYQCVSFSVRMLFMSDI